MVARHLSAIALAGALLVAGVSAAWADGPERLETVEFVIAVDAPAERLEAVARALLARLDRRGVDAAAAQDFTCGRVTVEVAASEDMGMVREALARRSFGTAEFRRVARILGEGACRAAAQGAQTCVADPKRAEDRESWLLTEPGIAMQEAMETSVGVAAWGDWQLDVRFGEADRQRLCTLTGESIGESIALVVGDEVLINAVVREPICGGALALTGSDFDEAGLAALAERIAGATLPSYEIWTEAAITRRPIAPLVTMPEDAPAEILDTLRRLGGGSEIEPETLYATLREALGEMQAPRWANAPPTWADRRYFFEN